MHHYKICVKCAHCIIKKDNGIWYNYLCGHPSMRRQRVIDPVTGELSFGYKDEDGDIYVEREEFPYAKEVNRRGDCDLWEQYVAVFSGVSKVLTYSRRLLGRIK